MSDVSSSAGNEAADPRAGRPEPSKLIEPSAGSVPGDLPDRIAGTSATGQTTGEKDKDSASVDAVIRLVVSWIWKAITKAVLKQIGGFLGQLFHRASLWVVGSLSVLLGGAASPFVLGWLGFGSSSLIPAGTVYVVPTAYKTALKEVVDSFQDAYDDDPSLSQWPLEILDAPTTTDADERELQLERMTKRALNGDPALLVSIGTPSFKQAIMNAPGPTPVAFSATTNHSDTVSQMQSNGDSISSTFDWFGIDNYSPAIAEEIVRAVKELVGMDAVIVFVRSKTEANSIELFEGLKSEWRGSHGVQMISADEWAGDAEFKINAYLAGDSYEWFNPAVGRTEAINPERLSADVFVAGYDNLVAGYTSEVVRQIKRSGSPVLLVSASLGDVSAGRAHFAFGFDYEEMGVATYRLVKDWLFRVHELKGDEFEYRPKPAAMIDVDRLSRTLFVRDNELDQKGVIHGKIRSYIKTLKEYEDEGGASVEVRYVLSGDT
ncbi:MAG: hypothetical protein AAGI53_16005 [Planctomycetota bacterium]